MTVNCEEWTRGKKAAEPPFSLPHLHMKHAVILSETKDLAIVIRCFSFFLSSYYFLVCFEELGNGIKGKRGKGNNFSLTRCLFDEILRYVPTLRMTINCSVTQHSTIGVTSSDTDGKVPSNVI